MQLDKTLPFWRHLESLRLKLRLQVEFSYLVQDLATITAQLIRDTWFAICLFQIK